MKNRKKFWKKRKFNKTKSSPTVIAPVEGICMDHSFCLHLAAEHVYDGDTVRDYVVNVWPGINLDADIRLARIQAPEIRTRDLEEKSMGYEAKAYLQTLVVGKKTILKIIGKGKYGRLIGELFTEEGDSISDLMMKQGYARKY